MALTITVVYGPPGQAIVTAWIETEVSRPAERWLLIMYLDAEQGFAFPSASSWMVPGTYEVRL